MNETRASKGNSSRFDSATGFTVSHFYDNMQLLLCFARLRFWISPKVLAACFLQSHSSNFDYCSFAADKGISALYNYFHLALHITTLRYRGLFIIFFLEQG